MYRTNRNKISIITTLALEFAIKTECIIQVEREVFQISLDQQHFAVSAEDYEPGASQRERVFFISHKNI